MKKEYKFTKEHRQKLSEAHKGKIPSNLAELIAYSRSIEGKKRNSERMKGFIPWNKGIKGWTKNFKGAGFPKGHPNYLTNEIKKKMSKIAKEKGFGKWMNGKKHTEEWKKKMSKKVKKEWQEGKRKGGWKLSEKDKRNLGEKNKGEKCHFWKGGKMAKYPENCRIRKSQEYQWWRKSIYNRDNFTCQRCKTSGGYLIAHHINNFADFIELRLNIDNGITLCKTCHDIFHKKYGKHNNTKEQLEEFLQSLCQ